MHPLRTLLLASATVLAAVGVATASEQAGVHVLTLHLPGGGTEVIRYTGDVAPQVTVSNGPMSSAFGGFPDASARDHEPMAADSNAPFAMMQRMQAAMRRQTAAMLQRARSMQAAASVDAREPGVPGDGRSFSLVTTAPGSGYCARSVQITSVGDGKPPKIVSKTYGDCGSRGRAQGTAPGADATGPVSQSDTM
jgi:hypothetical protein